MSFGFMRTGFDLVADSGVDAIDDCKRKQIMGLLELFLEDALRIAARYTRLRGARKIGARHMKMSLQHAARTFFEQDDLEGRFAGVMARDDDDSMADDSSSGTDEGSSSSDVSDDEARAAPKAGEAPELSEDDVAFCAALERHVSEWSDWNPDDPAQALVKRSIDAVTLPSDDDS